MSLKNISIKKYIHVNKTIYYIERNGCLSKQQREKFCIDNLLFPLLKQFCIDETLFMTFCGLIFTERISTGQEDKYIPISNYFYPCDILKKTNKKIIISICVETRTIINNPSAQRFYFMGFSTYDNLNKAMLSKTFILNEDRDSRFSLNGWHPTEEVFIYKSNNFSLDFNEFKNQTEKEYKKQKDVALLELNNSNDVVDNFTPNNDDKENEIMEDQDIYQTSTRYVANYNLYIIQRSPFTNFDIYDFKDVSSLCKQRIDMLIKNDEQQIQNYSSTHRIWLKDRGVVSILLLVMCWKEEILNWYIKLECKYIERVLSLMKDVDDVLINIYNNKLEDLIKFKKEEKIDRNKICSHLQIIQERRIRYIVKMWKASTSLSLMDNELIRIVKEMKNIYKENNQS